MKSKKRNIAFTTYENHLELLYSSYTLVALDNAMKQFYDHLDYNDSEIQDLMITIHQESMNAARISFADIVDAAAKIEKKIYSKSKFQLQY